MTDNTTVRHHLPYPSGAVVRWTLPSPAGPLCLTACGEVLTAAEFADAPPSDDACPPSLRPAAAWLAAYFNRRPLPPLPALSFDTTPYRRAVWQELLAIPYGATVTYGDIDRSLKSRGMTSSPQAVGNAVGANPLVIFIPCHRVVSARNLGGYRYGLQRKVTLLETEGILAATPLTR